MSNSKNYDGDSFVQDEMAYYPGMSDRFIWVTEFNSQSLLSFYRKFSQLENDPSVGIIPIVVDSYGGEVYALNGMISLIKTSKKKVMTMTMSKAKSCGLSLLAAGSKGLRFISPYAEVLYHEASYFAGHEKVTDHEASAAVGRRLSDKLLNQLAADSGTPIEKLKAMVKEAGNADLQFTAEQALQLGFADHIGMPSISIEPPQWVVGARTSDSDKYSMWEEGDDVPASKKPARTKKGALKRKSRR